VLGKHDILLLQEEKQNILHKLKRANKPGMAIVIAHYEAQLSLLDFIVTGGKQ